MTKRFAFPFSTSSSKLDQRDVSYRLPEEGEQQHSNLSQPLILTSRPQPHIAAHTSYPHRKRVQQHSATVQPQHPQLARARHQQFRGLCLLLPAGAAPVCPPGALAGQKTQIVSKSIHRTRSSERAREAPEYTLNSQQRVRERCSGETLPLLL